MHKVKIHPGICGLITDVTAELIEDDMVKVIIKSDCQAIDKINSILGDQFDAFEVCLVRPGEDPFTQYAQEHFPPHASCPTISGIIKCIEAEAGLALPKDVQINFIKE
jgi:hypothetical protein